MSALALVSALLSLAWAFLASYLARFSSLSMFPDVVAPAVRLLLLPLVQLGLALLVLVRAQLVFVVALALVTRLPAACGGVDVT